LSVSAFRIIRLPPHLREIPEVMGIPDLFSTRCICFVSALLCLVACLGLGVAFVSDNRIQWTSELSIVVIMWLALIAGSVVALMRAGGKAGAWFCVDATGMWYGTGRLSTIGVSSSGTCIKWDEIVAKPGDSCDVRTEFQTSRSFTKNFVFWCRRETGEIVEQRIPMRLTSNFLRCVRFRNRDDLTVAMLRGLASRPGLRFHLDVFVDAGIHPETWMPMKRPRRMMLLLSVVSALASALFIMHAVLSLPAWMTICGMLVVSIVVGALGYAIWAYHYGDLVGVASFDGSE